MLTHQGCPQTPGGRIRAPLESHGGPRTGNVLLLWAAYTMIDGADDLASSAGFPLACCS